MLWYCYDGDQVIAEYVGTTLMRKFIYGPGIDEPVMMISISGETETPYYYHFDGLGSVIALSDSNGDIVETYSYDVFGDPNRISSVSNPYLFTGRRYDSETDLYYYRARYYKPAIGRFMQTDPIGSQAGPNLYTYCRNNPANWIDPWGLIRWSPWPGSGYYHGDAGHKTNPKHTNRNHHNRAYQTKQEAESSPYFIKEDDNPFHWPDTYRGMGPYEGSQASYYPSDPTHPEYDPTKAGLLDDETSRMGTYDYCPPYRSRMGHFFKDIWPHFFDDNSTPGLSQIIEGGSSN